MTGPAGPGQASALTVDLRRAPLAALRSVDYRAAERDLAADEAALFDRLTATWAGLDDAAWHLPGAAPSDAGGPDWSLAEHVGHVADWQELATDYVRVAIDTGRWPSDDDYDGGDFDRYNERRRAPWTTMPAAAIEARLRAARPRLLRLVGELAPDALRGHAAWGWVHMTLHGHYLDHLAVIEPWTAELRARQTEGDPFVADPRAADHEGLLEQDGAIQARFDTLVRSVPAERWLAGEPTPGWTLGDHVGHLADWMEEGARALEAHRRDGTWASDPEEGIDAWNERHAAAHRGMPRDAVLERYDAARALLLGAVGRASLDALRSPDGWSWVYDCLHGHVRKHLAMLGPWIVALDWPERAAR
ncbi:MAG: DinB family protein [Candidatus Limnocylindria bacterium]